MDSYLCTDSAQTLEPGYLGSNPSPALRICDALDLTCNFPGCHSPHP